ncbi:MAG TPA: multicopper oxidase family protein [Gemmatimonadaceae bacterium]|nr:multicopper oxidase family protein [Gemmatimonadaceae bacterium]
MARRCTLLALLTVSSSLLAQSPQRATRSVAAIPARTNSGPKAESFDPPVLVNTSKLPNTVEVSITAAVSTVSMQPGTTSEVFAYNGSVPGPTLDVREGDHVIVHFRNSLPEPTTVHWHGIHLPFESDGSPFHPIKPGETRDYKFTVQPGTAGTYWYHPHPDRRTGFAIGKGLFGGIVVRAANDPLPPMPDKLIILSDNRFLKDGMIDFPDPMSHHGGVDEENGREGPVLFVNGHVMPVISIRSGEVQRWRIVNGSAGRIYRLALPGRAFVQVGTDGGLFEKPVEVKDIVLATGERVEVIVRGTDPPGTKTTLQNLPYDRYAPQTRPTDWETTRDLLTLQTTDEAPVTPIAIPATLRKIIPLDTAKSTAVRTIVFSQGLINGKTMDMTRVDVSTTVGATEIWEIENIVGMDHPFHLHGFQFQVLDRDGVPEPYRAWKDMLNIRKHTSARIIVRYDDYPGKWMFHCHILDHEDHGMMGVLEVK